FSSVVDNSYEQVRYPYFHFTTGYMWIPYRFGRFRLMSSGCMDKVDNRGLFMKHVVFCGIELPKASLAV
ncbi:hypothetical protein, partial [Salmonella enterica]|uniref:hypothetical protein n=1 Tax=Salmonella enterica TaxID=28901 RepID=UPI001CB7465C